MYTPPSFLVISISFLGFGNNFFLLRSLSQVDFFFPNTANVKT